MCCCTFLNLQVHKLPLWRNLRHRDRTGGRNADGMYLESSCNCGFMFGSVQNPSGLVHQIESYLDGWSIFLLNTIWSWNKPERSLWTIRRSTKAEGWFFSSTTASARWTAPQVKTGIVWEGWGKRVWLKSETKKFGFWHCFFDKFAKVRSGKII